MSAFRCSQGILNAVNSLRMPTKREQVRTEMISLYKEGLKLADEFQKKKERNFPYFYQIWYTKALKVVASLAPDRVGEFRGYYEPDPKRKILQYGTYVIQDFLRNIVPSTNFYEHFDSRSVAINCFWNQLTIFNAVLDRLDSALNEIESALYVDLQGSEVATARQLAKVNLRAAGALVGIVIEGHLQKVAAAHAVTVAKKNPTIADLNEPLKAASVIDIPTWRKITYLADLRNLCAHKKDREPTENDIKELIEGAEWVSKNVF